MNPLARLIVIALSAACVDASGAELPSLQARVDAMFRSFKPTEPGCAVGVTRRGSWVARGGYGSASLEHAARITPDTVFYIGSVSKQFTAAALLTLVDRGVVALSDDVRKYVPELPEYKPAVTLDDLAHHTSGIEDYLKLLQDAHTMVNRHSTDEILGMIAAAPQRFAAGTGYSYSNSNYLLIGEVVKRASGKSLRAYAREALFAPLGMKDTRYFDDFTEVVPRYATGYFREDDGYHVAKTLYAQVGAGGLLTTLNDLGRWMRIYDDPGAIPSSPHLGERMQEPGRLDGGIGIDYAYGLVMTRERDLRIASHAGYFPGYRAQVTWIPERRVALLVMCNESEAPTTAITNNLMNEALR